MYQQEEQKNGETENVFASGSRLRKVSETRCVRKALVLRPWMYADDDGVVEAFTVLRMTGATEDALNDLEERGLIVVLNDDLVTYIVDWKRNNYIQNDRHHTSEYADLLRDYLSSTEK